jgi:nucleoside-diphosphate-sugar epimerase
MNEQNETRRVLITGGAGFVGAHLVRALALRKAEITVADCQPRGVRSPLQSFGLIPFVEYLEVDVTNEGAMDRIISGKFDIIFHLAAQPIGYISERKPDKTMSCNVESTRNMLNLVREGRARQLILASSACAFGVPDAKKCPLKEDSPMSAGIYPYTESKQNAETLVRESGVRASIARFVNLFGEADWHSSRIVPRIVRQLLLDKPLSLSRSNGRAVLDFLHVSDAVAGLLHVTSYVARFPASTEFMPVFNFGSGMPISILELIEQVCLAFDGRARPVAIPHSIREPRMHKYLDSTRAEQQLGWRPQVGRKLALRQTIEWYARHGSKLHNIDEAFSESADGFSDYTHGSQPDLMRNIAVCAPALARS